MKKIKKSSKKAGIVHSTVKAGAVIGIFVSLIWAGTGFIPKPVVDEQGWHIVWEGNFAQAAEANPGAGASGILEIFFVNHSASNVTENTSATVEGWCDDNNLGYASADDFDVEIAHSVTFDIAIKVRANQTNAYRTDKFFDSDVRVRMTSSDLGISADTVLTGHVLQNDSSDSFIWMMFETKGSDTNGFSLTKDESNDITSIKFECYY